MLTHLGKLSTLTSSHTAGTVKVCIKLNFSFSLIYFLPLFLPFFANFCIELCFSGGHSAGETRKKSECPNKGPTFRLCSTRNWAAGGSCLSEAKTRSIDANGTSSYTLSLFFLNHLLPSSSRVRSEFQANAVSTTREKCLVRKLVHTLAVNIP